MEVVLIGPYVSPAALSLLQVIGSRDRGRSEDGLVYDKHTSSMYALVPQVARLVADSPWGPIEIRGGATRFGVVTLRLTVTDREELHALEPAVAEHVNALLSNEFENRSEGTSSYASGKVLWWHRLLLDPRGDEPRAIRVFGERFLATDVATGCVANGFTSLEASADSVVDEVVDGLIAATEDWLLIDDLSRSIRDTLVSAQGDEDVLGHALARAELLSEEIALAVLLMDERRRHEANGTQRVHTAAASVWGLVEDRDALIRNAESVQALIRTEYERRSAQVDAKRNSLLFGFALATILQSALLMLDFAVGAQLSVASVVRVALAGAIAVATSVVIGRYFFGGKAGSDPRAMQP